MTQKRTDSRGIATFDDAREGTGTKEWAERNENITRGCSHRCIYCYAAANAARFKLRPREDWGMEELTKRAFITSYPRVDGVVMFPSSHDNTESNLEAYLRVAKLILGAGNRLLIVSKPHYGCISRIVSELDDHKQQIMFRFTITTTDEAVAAFWEPGAPSPTDRIASLRLAHAAGYRTSVSAEPLLGGVETAVAVMDAVRPYLTDSVWVGRLNRAHQRADMSDPAIAAEVARVEALQDDAAILALYQRLNGEPFVRWKDSVATVLKAHGLM